MGKFEEKTITTTNIFEGKVVQLQVDDVSLPNGKQSKREIIKHPGAVAVIAVTENNKVLVVEQFRKPLEKTIIEIPAGKLEPGESPKVTAIRELEEETGYTTDDMEHVTSFYTSPGFADELIHLFYTDKLLPLQEKKELDEDEFVEVMEISIEEADQLINQKKIYDAKTAYAFIYLKLKGIEKK